MTDPRGRVRVLIADDSALMRRTLRRVVEEDEELEVIECARDGEDVVAKARALRPDVVTMDINMPKLDGISALQLLVHEGICPVIMVSSLSQDGALATFEALELGAFDYVGKPAGTVSTDLSTVANELRTKLKAAGSQGTLSRLCRRASGRRITEPKAGPDSVAPRSSPEALETSIRKAVAIGISTGGPSTIIEVIPKIPNDTDAAFFLVQHMPGTFTRAFAKRLDDASSLTVLEAEGGMPVEANHCYVAKGDFHMTLHRDSRGRVLIRTPTRPETLFKPSVDVTMASVLATYGRNTIGVLMTGIGDDGASTMVKIVEAGGYTIAESEESAIVWGMPREAIERGGAKEVVSSHKVASAIVRQLRQWQGKT